MFEGDVAAAAGGGIVSVGVELVAAGASALAIGVELVADGAAIAAGIELVAAAGGGLVSVGVELVAAEAAIAAGIELVAAAGGGLGITGVELVAAGAAIAAGVELVAAAGGRLGITGVELVAAGSVLIAGVELVAAEASASAIGVILVAAGAAELASPVVSVPPVAPPNVPKFDPNGPSSSALQSGSICAKPSITPGPIAPKNCSVTPVTLHRSKCTCFPYPVFKGLVSVWSQYPASVHWSVIFMTTGVPSERPLLSGKASVWGCRCQHWPQPAPLPPTISWPAA